MTRYFDNVSDGKLELLAQSVRKLTKRLDMAGIPPMEVLSEPELAACMELSEGYPEPPTAEEGHHD